MSCIDRIHALDAVDCHPQHADSIGVLVNLMRYIWGFVCISGSRVAPSCANFSKLGPFWFPTMFANLTYIGSGGLMVGMVLVFSVCPIIFLQLRQKVAQHSG